jgi:hypothetical protein
VTTAAIHKANLSPVKMQKPENFFSSRS